MCRLHGHSYRVVVHVAGPVGVETGRVMDFQELEDAFAPFLDLLDHRCLNEVAGLDNPTSENLARWIWERLVGMLPLAKIVVRETRTSGCVYRGEVT